MLGKPIDEQEVLKMYQEDKTLTITSIAYKLKVDRRRISKIFIDNGVEIRYARKKISDEEKRIIIKKYFEDGMKAAQIAREHQLPEYTIRNYLRKDSRYVIREELFLEQEEKEKIIKEYLENDISHQDLAEKYGKDRSWATRLINQTVVEDAKFASKRKDFSERKKTPKRWLNVSAEQLIYENEVLKISQRKLAEKYGVSTSCIYHAIARYKGRKE